MLVKVTETRQTSNFIFPSSLVFGEVARLLKHAQSSQTLHENLADIYRNYSL